MNNYERDVIKVGFVIGLIMILVFGAVHFLKSKAQADVWRTAGVSISTWQVMCGAKPIQVNVNLTNNSVQNAGKEVRNEKD